MKQIVLVLGLFLGGCSAGPQGGSDKETEETAPSLPVRKTDESQADSQGCFRVVRPNGLRLRVTPALAGQQLAILPKLTLVKRVSEKTATADNHDWWEVATTDATTVQTGWVVARYLPTDEVFLTKAPCASESAPPATDTLALTGSFDGSRSFLMWTDALALARSVATMTGKPAHFTFFINGVYYQTERSMCAVGKAATAAEVLARWGITQQAINEGHEIGNHSMWHGNPLNEACRVMQQDYKFWQQDMSLMHKGEVSAQTATLANKRYGGIDHRLFQPLFDHSGQSVFPKWVARGAAGEIGASCRSDTECAVGNCADGRCWCQAITATQSFCTRPCQKNIPQIATDPCPDSSLGETVCGGADWTNRSDLCVPVPKYDVDYTLPSGQLVKLFTPEGLPTAEAISAGVLKPYTVLGMRAPFLAFGPALFSEEEKAGYLYDASVPDFFGVGYDDPWKLTERYNAADWRHNLWVFPLIRPKTQPMPFDSVYADSQACPSVMRKNYRDNIVLSLSMGLASWSINSHFNPWLPTGGAWLSNCSPEKATYWDIYKETFIWAAQGCDGQCAGKLDFISYAETLTRLGH